MNELLKFEREGFDFPFYKDNLSKDRWIALILGFLINAIMVIFSPQIKAISPVLFAVLFAVIPTIAFAYASKGDFSLILKKPVKKDIWLIIKMIILSYVFAILAGFTIKTLGFSFSPHIGFQIEGIGLYITLAIQIWGEELLKFLLFIVLFALLIKSTNTRKKSMVISVAVTLVCFALLHFNAYSGRIAQILVMQGLGSIFTVFAYLKTKNIFVSYMIHFIIDFISVISPV